MTFQISEHDAISDEVIVRDMTAEELAEREAIALKNAQTKAEAEAEKQAKATARQAVLDRLGITSEEAALILGGNN
jgi:hypothetical protein